MTVTLSLDPLLHYSQSNTAWGHVVGDIELVRVLLINVLLLALGYPFLHRVLLKLFKSYGDIKPSSKQVIVLHHAMESILLTILLPIFSHYFFRVFFQVHEIGPMISNVRACTRFGFLILIMYLFEVSSRYESPRPLVLFHHVLAYVDGNLAAWITSSIMVKTALILVFFICFEAFTFAGLFMYRICPENKYTSKMIIFGMIVFGLTRPLQILLVGAVAYGSWNDESQEKWQIIFQCVVTMILSTLQLYTLKIHYAVWKRATIIPGEACRFQYDASSHKCDKTDQKTGTANMKDHV